VIVKWCPLLFGLLVALVTVSCTSGRGTASSTGSPVQSGSGSPAVVVARPKICGPVGNAGLAENPNPTMPGISRLMVPGSPTVAVECLGKKRRVFEDAKLTKLATLLNELPPMPKRVVCLDWYGPPWMLFFDYATGPRQFLVTVDPNGCTGVWNGKKRDQVSRELAVFLNPQLAHLPGQ
jgi:hypothetical protein